MRDSLFRSSIRAFFIAMCTMIGLTIGFFVLILLVGALAGTAKSEPEIPYTYTVKILPNAMGKRKILSKEAPVILKLNVTGVIGSETLNRHTVEKLLIESREQSLKDNRVKAILLNIDSPGGTVVDANGIYQAIKNYKEAFKVPVYAYVDGLCASGGMYVAAAADKIFATDVSLIGSVGVISPPFFNVSKLMENIGVKALTLSAGKGKDDLNPTRPWREGEQDNFEKLIAYYYEHFVDLLTGNRPQIDKKQLVDALGAAVFPAIAAKEHGFIDEAPANFNDTLTLLAKKIGIEDDYYQLVELENKSWFAELFSEDNEILKGKVKHQLDLPAELNPHFLNQFLYLYRPTD